MGTADALMDYKFLAAPAAPTVPSHFVFMYSLLYTIWHQAHAAQACAEAASQDRGELLRIRAHWGTQQGRPKLHPQGIRSQWSLQVRPSPACCIEPNCRV